MLSGEKVKSNVSEELFLKAMRAVLCFSSRLKSKQVAGSGARRETAYGRACGRIVGRRGCCAIPACSTVVEREPGRLSPEGIAVLEDPEP